MEYIKSMRGVIQRARGYGENGFQLVVSVSFDAVQFKAFQKAKQCPLEVGMPQIKNVVLDACGVRGIPSYARASYTHAFPRAKKGLVTLTVYFECSEFNAKSLGVDVSDYCLYHSIDLKTTLEATRNDGHLFAKSVIAQKFGN